MSVENRSAAIQRFIPLVDFLGTFLGKDCEVVLHDTSRPDSSVVAIANSHISGRRVGSPITDLALQLMKAGTSERESFVIGYKSQARDGRALHSATYFIREDDGTLAGMLCLNMDNTGLLEARDLIERFIQRGRMEKPRPEPENGHSLETFAESLEDLTGSSILQVVNGAEIPPERMTPDEKIAIVRTLNDKGVFLLKGAVAVVARHLAASEATVYRYLQRVTG
ncbi:helix-turn-helix transcriptional regulator [Oleidesulfovibrio alaskensis]|uniref:helix-turn-helix transcriptional regulator n=1 Tax=Oleidesulfovibrio alaskensis TaxID=58180 RepID=UPI0004177704|nr:PAS domain-containing protein [Oleidesulfovibrio alaskensis]